MDVGQVIGITAAVTVGAVIAGIIIAAALKHAKENDVIDREKLLEECFGEHIYTESFSASQASAWLQKHKEKMKEGTKALVMKITPSTLSELGVKAEITPDMDNFLAIAVVDAASKKMIDSLLVKYEALDEKLEEMLAKGNGTMVIGG